jgi:cardiolipin synthase (CMP-forming)
MSDVLTMANQLTLLRMALIPAFAISLIYGYLGTSLAVFTLAGVTDMFDGLVARRSGQQTTLGAWLDPAADKLLLVTMFVVLTLPLDHLTHRIPLWLTMLVIGRDIGIVVTVAVVNMAVGRRTFHPSWLGKLATATFIVTGTVTLLYNVLAVPSVVPMLLVYASLAITLVSAADYLRRTAFGG